MSPERDDIVPSEPDPDSAHETAPPDDSGIMDIEHPPHSKDEQPEREFCEKEETYDPHISALNGMITDAMAEARRLASDHTGAITTGGFAPAAAESAALAMLNAVQAQQNAAITANAVVVAAVRGISEGLRARTTR